MTMQEVMITVEGYSPYMIERPLQLPDGSVFARLLYICPHCGKVWYQEHYDSSNRYTVEERPCIDHTTPTTPNSLTGMCLYQRWDDLQGAYYDIVIPHLQVIHTLPEELLRREVLMAIELIAHESVLLPEASKRIARLILQENGHGF